MPNFVSIITPTIGRETLQRACDSVDAQTDEDFIHVVAGDGLKPNVDWSDRRVVVRCGHHRHESLVRNAAIRATASEWVGFLDDDDTLSPNYVRWLKEEANDSGADVVIFRQTLPKLDDVADTIIPSDPVIIWGNVGISYAVKREHALAHPFKRTQHEDLLQLTALEASGSKIHFSNHLAYFGRDHKG